MAFPNRLPKAADGTIRIKTLPSEMAPVVPPVVFEGTAVFADETWVWFSAAAVFDD